MPLITYTFTPAEIKAARTVGKLRKESKDGIRTTPLFDGRDHIHDETVGVLGEAAVGKYLRRKVDTSINLCGDGGIDFEYHGMTIDAKSIEYKTGVLVYNSRDKFRSDIAILVIVNYQDLDENGELLPYEQQTASARLCGWIRRGEFMERCHDDDLGKGPRVTCPQSRLNPMRTFPLHQNN